jgi:hypothetical protein
VIDSNAAAAILGWSAAQIRKIGNRSRDGVHTVRARNLTSEVGALLDGVVQAARA